MAYRFTQIVGQVKEQIEALGRHVSLVQFDVCDRQKTQQALLADVEEPRVFASYGNLNFRNDSFKAILLGVGLRKKN